MSARDLNASGIPLRPFYEEPDPPVRRTPPGQFPYTRGVRRDMYRGRLWTMRQFAGFGTAEETNERFHYLLAQGQTGLSTAFDMPSLMGHDSDHPKSLGEVGREGVAVDTLDDMATLFGGIDLGAVSVSMTINAPAAIMLAFYVVAAEEAGVPADRLSGTIQADILKEYIAQKEWCFPVDPAMRLCGDMIEWCTRTMPRWHPISISGYHIREAGSTAAQELAFTLKDGLTYVEQAIGRGLEPRRMPGLADDGAVEQPGEQVEEGAHRPGLEDQRRRQLNQQHAEPVTQRRHVGQEARQQGTRGTQALIVRDGARHLHREAEAGGTLRGPALVDLRPVGTIERGVDLGAVHHAGVPGQVTAVTREVLGCRPRDAPSRGPDSQLARRRAHANRRLTKRDPRSPKRQGRSRAFEMPIRGPTLTSGATSAGRTSNGGRSRGSPSWARVIPSACPRRPGPEHRSRSSSTPRRARITSRPSVGSSARINTPAPWPASRQTTLKHQWRPCDLYT